MTGRDFRLDSALRPQPRRHGLDAWQTPKSLIDALITHVEPTLPAGIIWEPAAGHERLADAMRIVGREVIATDLDGGLDFLHDHPPPPRRFAAIVTNPPFNRLDEFVGRALTLMDLGATQSVALLMRYDATMASGRVDTLNRAALEIGCNWRARWIENSTGQPRWAFKWIVWRADQSGPPLTLRVRRPVP